ncbi:MAG: ABC transporter ATP-binding protein [Acidimicrobiia bacterium]
MQADSNEIDALGEPALAVADLHVEFRTHRGWVTVVDGVSFEVRPGEVLGLVGESGSGKSVTSLAVMGLTDRSGRVSRGSVRLDGRELIGLSDRSLEDVRGDRIAMIFQEPMTSLNPAFTVGDQIGEVLRRHRGASRRQARARAIEVLDLVGIPHAARRVHSYPHEMSGGMRQRAMIAMAIACEPTVLIADEPTTALDVTIQAQILDLLRDMRAELGMAMLFVTHNMGVVADICDRVVVMYAGQVVEEAPTDDLFDCPRHPYSSGLLEAMPRLAARVGRLSSIPGAPPAPWDFGTGCRFVDRCSYADATCADPVMLVAGPPGRSVRCVRVNDLDLTRSPQ